MRRRHRQESDHKYMKPVPETGSTLSEGPSLVKPRGLSGGVVVGFPIKQVRERTMAHTMREVARRAGVLLATVSRVLNNTQYIPEATRRRVLDAVREFNYFKNVHARRLATGRSDLFGLVISEIANPYFPEIIRGYQAMAWNRGFDVLICNTEYDRERTKAVMRKLRESDVRGVAVVTSSVDKSMASELTAAGIPVVLCNSDPAGKLVGNICRCIGSPGSFGASRDSYRSILRKRFDCHGRDERSGRVRSASARRCLGHRD
jgi:hypothetical protein